MEYYQNGFINFGKSFVALKDGTCLMNHGWGACCGEIDCKHEETMIHTLYCDACEFQVELKD